MADSTDGNGRGLTQREMLMELREGQVQILARLEGLGVRMSVHEAKPIHDGAAQRLAHVEGVLDSQRAYINKGLGIVAVLVLLVPVIVSVIFHS